VVGFIASLRSEVWGVGSTECCCLLFVMVWCGGLLVDLFLLNGQWLQIQEIDGAN